MPSGLCNNLPETCRAASAGLASLRIGGRLLVAGLVSPGGKFAVDGNQLTRRYLTVRGIHNYHPAHLGKGLNFLESTAAKYPFDSLVHPVLELAHIRQAFEPTGKRTSARVALRCSK